MKKDLVDENVIKYDGDSGTPQSLIHDKNLTSCASELRARLDGVNDTVIADVNRSPVKRERVRNRLNVLTTSKKVAFTLAEILVTLAVIGIVAAMTIPTLVQGYKKKVTAVKVKKAYAEMVQAIRLSEVDNGPVSTWTYNFPASSKSNDEFSETYIMPYFKNHTKCSEGSKCVPGISTYAIGYKLNNGVGISLGGAVSASDYRLPIVISTGNKNIMGVDKFYFKLDLKTGQMLPAGWFDGITREDVLNGFYGMEGGREKSFFMCSSKGTTMPDWVDKESYNSGNAACAALLMLDGWEFKDDYPLKF